MTDNTALLAQIDLAPEGGFTLPGVLGNPGGSAPTLFADVVSAAIGLITVVAAIWFVFKIITGAIGVISAGGDSGKIAKARSDITMGFVGIIIVVFSTVIVDLLFNLLGISEILNIPSIIDIIAP